MRAIAIVSLATCCGLALAVPRPATSTAPAVPTAPVALAPALAANVTKGCIDRFDPAADYFPDKVTIEDAANFGVEYHRSYKVVRVREPDAGGPPERYVLVQCGAPVPPLSGDLAGAQIVRVPIASLYSGSTTHQPLLVDLGRLDVLTGVVSRGVLDPETVVASQPSMFMTGGAFSAQLAAIKQAGVPVVANTEWLEPTALARAEWIKYMALFLNEERKAQEVYGAMTARYRALRAKATATPRETWPLVMTGRSNRGAFVIAGGKSYVAALIADAGGRYIWVDNTSTGSSSIDLELQIARAANADIWINGGGWANLAAMLDDEPRYAELKAYRQGQVWVYERRLTPSGENDYWTRSISHPDLVLADLIKIFHPSLLPEHAFEWYMQVPAR